MSLKSELLGKFRMPDAFVDYTPAQDASLWGWNSSSPVLTQFINAETKIIIEVGSWLGKSSIHMGSFAKNKKIDFVLICIDTWLGSWDHWRDNQSTLKLSHGYPRMYFDFLSNIKNSGLEDYVIPIPLPSTVGAAFLKNLAPELRADIIYVDGSHETQDVYCDLVNFWPLVKPEGILIADDYPMDCVRLGIQHFVTNYKLENLLAVQGEKCFFRKPV